MRDIIIKEILRIEGRYVNKDTIKPFHNLINDIGFDSIDIVDLIMCLEKEFGIKITEEEWSKCHTVQDVINLTESLNDSIL